MVIHQSNYLRIQQLRETSRSLDETIKTTIKLLADTRRDILAIPASDTAEEERREIGVNELLSYAKFISRTTVPPTIRKQAEPPQQPKREVSDAQLMNGVSSPPSGAVDAQQKQEQDAEKTEDAEKAEKVEKPELYAPWPSPDLIKAGALGNIQKMLEGGVDPASVLTAEEQAEADKKRQEDDEREKSAREEAEKRRMSMFDTGSARRRPTMSDVFNPDDL